MHTERILKLAGIIESRTGERFDMISWNNCIAGFAVRHANELVDEAEAVRLRRRYGIIAYADLERPGQGHVAGMGAELLGLPGWGEGLFTAGFETREQNEVRRAHIKDRAHWVKVLRHLAATGQIEIVNPVKGVAPVPVIRQPNLFKRILARVARNERTIRNLEMAANKAAPEAAEA